MIDTELEEFTAAEAINAGLVDAIKDGSAKVSGTYELKPNGVVEFNQNNFVFNDKFGGLRIGKFKSNSQLKVFLNVGSMQIQQEMQGK